MLSLLLGPDRIEPYPVVGATISTGLVLRTSPMATAHCLTAQGGAPIARLSARPRTPYAAFPLADGYINLAPISQGGNSPALRITSIGSIDLLAGRRF
jgi:hypothetical protein